MLGSTDFQFMGTSQLLSVPYALFAGKSANAADDFDKDSTNELQTINKVGSTVTLSKGGGSVIDYDNQTLLLAGSLLTISNGNTVQLGGTIDLDWDPLNEIQNLSIHNDTLKISNSNYVLLPPDADADSTNELQLLSKNGNQITLSKNGGTVIDSDNQNLSLTTNGTNRTINISNGTAVNFSVKDADSDSINELQILNLSNDTLYLSKGNYVVFPEDNDKDSTNEIQNISINYKTISISKSNSVTINWGPTYISRQPLTLYYPSFNTIDVSAFVPVGATSIILEVAFGYANGLHCRKNASSEYVNLTGSGETLQFTVPIDTNRTFQCSIDNSSNIPTPFIIAYY